MIQKKKTQIDNICNERGYITLDFTDIKKDVKGILIIISASKFDNLDEMNKFL